MSSPTNVTILRLNNEQKGILFAPIDSVTNLGHIKGPTKLASNLSTKNKFVCISPADIALLWPYYLELWAQKQAGPALCTHSYSEPNPPDDPLPSWTPTTQVPNPVAPVFSFNRNTTSTTTGSGPKGKQTARSPPHSKLPRANTSPSTPDYSEWIDELDVGSDSDANEQPPELTVLTILTSLTDALTSPSRLNWPPPRPTSPLSSPSAHPLPSPSDSMPLPAHQSLHRSLLPLPNDHPLP